LPNHWLLLNCWLRLFELLLGYWDLRLLEFFFDDLVADWHSLHLSEAKLLLLYHFLKPEFLLLVVVFEIVKQLCTRLEVGKDLQHFFSNFWIDLLAVTTLASWLVLVVWVLDVNELGVWNILDVNPLDPDRTWPLA